MGLTLARPTFRSRADAIDWARGVAGDPTSCFLDTETTGLDGEAEIIEVSVLGLDGGTLLDTLVFPTLPIPDESTKVHGIRDADVIGAPYWAQVYRELADVVRDRRVVVYNADFDFRVTNQCCRAAGLVELSAEWQCAMKAFAAFNGERNRFGFRSIKLELAAAGFGIEPGGHRARADADACRQVVLAIAQANVNG